MGFKTLFFTLAFCFCLLAGGAATAETHAAPDNVAASDAHGDEKEEGGIPLDFAFLVVVALAIAVAPSYHKLNVGEGDESHS